MSAEKRKSVIGTAPKLTCLVGWRQLQLHWPITYTPPDSYDSCTLPIPTLPSYPLPEIIHPRNNSTRKSHAILPHTANNQQDKLPSTPHCKRRYVGQEPRYLSWWGRFSDLGNLIASRKYATMATDLKTYKFNHSMYVIGNHLPSEIQC